jgi:hypothetical protein
MELQTEPNKVSDVKQSALAEVKLPLTNFQDALI